MGTPNAQILEKVYGEVTESAKRYESLAENYKKNFGSEEVEFFTAPGRTEIIGNHTDHNGGKVVAASISMDTIGAAYPNQNNTIELVSEGYDKIVIDLAKINEIPINNGTLSLIAGMVEAARKFGYKVEGFNAYVSTQVISSAGVSSSASFEMLICSIINYFFNDSKIDYVTYARIGQYAENHFWSKASGLMDQMACAVGGPIMLDFNGEVTYKKVDFNFKEYGYDMVIVNTGKGHADLSREYSEVPMEMKAIAKELGVEILAQSSLEEMMNRLPKIVGKIENDRAILRAIHFFEETDRVMQMEEVIEKKSGKDLLRLLSESGDSSWEYLQNCYTTANEKEQKITLSLALTKMFLKKKNDGCCRVHGGGFAGVIMALVPVKDTEEYVEYMAKLVGKENVYPMSIRAVGAVHLEK